MTYRESSERKLLVEGNSYRFQSPQATMVCPITLEGNDEMFHKDAATNRK